jgi:hypothetical protein
MKFDNVGNIDYNCVQRCKRRFKSLTLELGIRHNNEHVGSGLGGNNFQLMTLMDYKHELINNRNLTVSANHTTNTFSWGSHWLAHVSAYDARKALDRVFNKMPESKKVMAVAFEALIESNCILKSFEKHKSYFPNLTKCLSGNFYLVPKDLDMKEKLILASIICQNLAIELDAGNKTNITKVGAAMSQFPDEVYLLAVRRYIQIERLIKFSLDEDVAWAPSLIKINCQID